MLKDLNTIFSRDLDKLRLEIESFKKEENIWSIKGNIINSSGNLCLHLLGNLNTYIGKNLGGTNYIRDREAEFNTKNVSKQQLVSDIIALKMVIQESFSMLREEDLDHLYPENTLGYEMTTRFFLIHLVAHFSYHLGQINYLRRILEN